MPQWGIAFAVIAEDCLFPGTPVRLLVEVQHSLLSSVDTLPNIGQTKTLILTHTHTYAHVYAHNKCVPLEHIIQLA